MKKRMTILIFPFLAACSTPGKIPFTGTSAPDVPTYSSNPQMGVPTHRQYRRMTRSAMEEESELQSQAGSMWVNEGQTSYLFVQNKTRREGDILNVKLDGAAQRQVETKVRVIKKLLLQLEQAAPGEMKQQLATTGPIDRSPASPAPAPAPAPAPEPVKDEREELKDVEVITTRLVERLPDGNYRVKGAQPFMIGKREYKVIVVGLIRPEDYNDEGVSSSKLLDPQFDVVSVRRRVSNE